MPARAEHDDAFVLRSVDYGDADRIVTLLTRRHGKLSALARSARNSKRRFAGSLSGFALIDVEIALGTGNLARLQSARVVRAHPALLTNLDRLTAAGALLSRCRELLPERVPEPELFDELQQMLEAISAASAAPALLRLLCEVRLLALSGFAPLLTACGRCGKRPAAGQAVGFDPARGCLACRACGGGAQRLHGNVREHLVQALEGEFVAAATHAWSDAERTEAERAVSGFIAHRISHTLPAR